MKSLLVFLAFSILVCQGKIVAQNQSEINKENVPQKYFSFAEIYQQDVPKDYTIRRFNSFDGVQIAYYQFDPQQISIATLVFIHGGGASSTLGYLSLAETLSKDYNVKTILMDLRGHGESAGRRGDTPSVQAVYQDISALLAIAKEDDQPLYLGGHSSGGGTVLNYSSQEDLEEVDGYFLISPYLGETANTEREDAVVFFEVDAQKFIDNATSGGVTSLNEYAVFFNYPEEVLKAEPSIVTALTVGMSNATTPYAAKEQFSAISVPYGLFIGEDDEVFDAQKVVEFDKLPTSRDQKSTAKIIKDKNHLSILNEIGKDIGETISRWIN